MARIKKHYDNSELKLIIGVVASNLIALRKNADLSQAEVARRANIAVSRVSEIENGLASDIKVSTICAIADAMGVSFEELSNDPEISFKDNELEILRKASRILSKVHQKIK